jgi:integrase/recombinase XerD
MGYSPQWTENLRYALMACTALATTLLDRGMPLEQIQKFLGHAKLETTQIYAETSTERIKESYQRALGG